MPFFVYSLLFLFFFLCEKIIQYAYTHIYMIYDILCNYNCVCVSFTVGTVSWPRGQPFLASSWWCHWMWVLAEPFHWSKLWMSPDCTEIKWPKQPFSGVYCRFTIQWNIFLCILSNFYLFYEWLADHICLDGKKKINCKNLNND